MMLQLLAYFAASSMCSVCTGKRSRVASAPSRSVLPRHCEAAEPHPAGGRTMGMAGKRRCGERSER